MEMSHSPILQTFSTHLFAFTLIRFPVYLSPEFYSLPLFGIINVWLRVIYLFIF